MINKERKKELKKCKDHKNSLTKLNHKDHLLRSHKQFSRGKEDR